LPRSRHQRKYSLWTAATGWIEFARRIVEALAALNRCSYERDHFAFVRNRAAVMIHSHAAKPEGRNLEAALSKFPLLHGLLG
jgi:hypothetical protein